MKTHIGLAKNHPVSQDRQTEISLHGGFEFLGATYHDSILFEGVDATPFFSATLRAPGGETMTLYVPATEIDRQCADALALARSLRTLAACAKEQPTVSRDTDECGCLRSLDRAS